MSRKDFSYMLARAVAARALRPFKRSKNAVGAVILPEAPASLDRSDWELAVNDVLNGYDPASVSEVRRTDNYTETVGVTKGKLIGFGVPLRRPWCYVVFPEAAETFAANPLSATLTFVQPLAIRASVMKHCVRRFTGQTLTDAQVSVLCTLSDDERALLVRKGVNVGAAIERFLEAREHAEARAHELKRNAEDGPRLSELHGYGDASEWGLELAQDLRDFREGRIAWEDVDSGLLLSGPPGCGKTTFAAALARECDVPFFHGSYATWQSFGHQGDMLKAMKDCFQKARETAPCVLLVDEVDGFVDREKSGHNEDYMRNVVNGLLLELDGAAGREGIIVIGACNNPNVLDPAIKRSGRLDRHIEIPLPDRDARIQILHMHLKREVPLLHLGLTTRKTEGMSGADLERFARDARRLARRERTKVTVKHVDRVLPGLIEIPSEKLRETALHEAGHAVVCACLTDMQIKALTLETYAPAVKQAMSAGCLEFDERRFAYRDREYITGQISTALGGAAAEQMIFGSHREGCFADFEHATALASLAIAGFGMGDSLASVGMNIEKATSRRLYDPAVARQVDRLLDEAMKRAKECLAENMDALHALAELLIERRKLSEADIRRVIAEHSQASQLKLSFAC